MEAGKKKRIMTTLPMLANKNKRRWLSVQDSQMSDTYSVHYRPSRNTITTTTNTHVADAVGEVIERKLSLRKVGSF